jgi:hypothetical protein
MNLRAVTYHWNGEQSSDQYHSGFIAQEVEKIFPEFVHTMGGKRAVAYTDMIPVLVESVQTEENQIMALDIRVARLESMVATSTNNSFSIADAISQMKSSFANGVAYLADAVVARLTVGTSSSPAGVTLYDTVTKAPYCLTVTNGEATSSPGVCGLISTTTPVVSTTTPVIVIATPQVATSTPVITIVGDNPATITIGTSYSDLGASVLETNPDGSVNNNLGLHYTVDGNIMTDISLDTSTTTVHTIVYSAVDGSGNWTYATRTVNVVGQ